MTNTVFLKKFYLVTGIGGARHGFVAGWLGTLPNFVDNHWYVDLETGHANGYMSVLSDLDQGMMFADFLKNKNFEFSSNAEKSLAGQCHGINLARSAADINNKYVTVIDIDTSAADPNLIGWEFLVKTYLRKNRTKHDCEEEIFWNIDKKIDLPQNLITDLHRIAAFKLLAETHKPMTRNMHNINVISLDYTKLFCHNGSVYLCNQLGLEVKDLYHEYWNLMLQFAKSPSTLCVWGYNWNRWDFFN